MENDDRVSNESSDQGSAVNEQPVVDASPKQRPPRMTPPPYVLDNHGGIVLDPSSALKLKDEQLRPTLYVGSSLLVRTTDLKNVLNEKFLAALEDQKLIKYFPNRQVLLWEPDQSPPRMSPYHPADGSSSPGSDKRID